MAAYFASKIVWRMCPTTRSTNASTKLLQKRNLKYSQKLAKAPLNPSQTQTGKSASTRNIHKTANNARMNRFDAENEFMNEMMQNNLAQEVCTFKEGTRYHLSDSLQEKSDQYINVLNYLMKVERGRCSTFPQLQPANQKPFGSISINCGSEMTRIRPVSIVYPTPDTKSSNSETKLQPFNVVNTVKSTQKLSNVDKKNYTTSAKALHPVPKMKIPADVPVNNANCNRIAEILQKTYGNNYRPAIKKICSMHEEAETQKRLKHRTKTKLTFSINSPRNIKSSRQSLLSFSKFEKPTNDSLIGQSTKNYNTSTTNDKATIEYVQLCTPQTEKKLSKLKSDGCPPYVPTPKMTSFNLKRLNKQEVPEPPKGPCESKYCPPRADGNLELQKKRLPNLKATTCKGVEPAPMKDASPLKRLKKTPVVQERPCPPVVTCPLRADEGLQILSKKLPSVPVSQCPPIEPEPLKDTAPLFKLKKNEVKEPLKICIQEKCPPRADDGLTIPQKKLPDIPSKACPCAEPEPLKEGTPIKRLNKGEVEEPKRVIPCVQDTCPPRADAGLTILSKKLQGIPPKFCPCVEPEPLKEGTPIKRLTKGPVVIPERKCIQEECPVKEQEIIEQRSLPKIQFNDCPPVEIPTVQSAPPLKRLEKVDIPEPQKECPKESCEQNPRADRDCWAYIKHLNVTNNENNDSHGKRNYSTCVIRTDDFANNSHSVNVQNSNKSLFNPIDFVNFIIYKTNLRQIGTTQNLVKNEDYLQPSRPIIPEKEPFSSPFDKNDILGHTLIKHTKKIQDTKELYEDEIHNVDVCCSKTCQDPMAPTPVHEPKCRRPPIKQSTIEQTTLWQKVVNYFKARPGCPTPEELRMKRLKEKAERAAEEAGLCLYDPKKCQICCKK